jgi:hypothetical protein
MNRLIVVTTAAAVFFLTGTTIALGSPADKQSPYVQTVYELLLNDGSRVYGQIEGESETEVVFRTKDPNRFAAASRRTNDSR